MWNPVLLAINVAAGIANTVALFILIPALSVPGYSPNSAQYQDSLRLALDLGRLDLATLILTAAGLGLAVAALVGYTHIQRSAEGIAREAAEHVAPASLERYMSENGNRLVQECLDNAVVVATLQRRFELLGIDDTDTAIDIERDPMWEPENDDG